MRIISFKKDTNPKNMTEKNKLITIARHDNLNSIEILKFTLFMSVNNHCSIVVGFTLGNGAY